MTDTLADTQVGIFGGVDTHADTHTVAAVAATGQRLGHATFPATAAGYRRLLSWLDGHGETAAIVKIGVEGTGSYGAGLTRFLTAAGLVVVEVNRPDRAERRRRGKSDPVDAEAAARAVLAGTATSTPKARTGVVEAIRVLRTARRGAVKARTATINTLKQLVVTAPEPLRAQLTGLSVKNLVATGAALRPDRASGDLTDPTRATKTALRRLARRYQHLDAEITDADTDLEALISQVAPDLLGQTGVGIDVAGQLLVTAGDNPDRIHTDASFAALCGASPLPASSGRTDRHRLNRGGDRHANAALHRVILNRMRWHQPTRDYVNRRRADKLTTKEIMRCLKRFLVRELLPLIRAALTTPTTIPTAP